MLRNGLLDPTHVYALAILVSFRPPSGVHSYSNFLTRASRSVSLSILSGDYWVSDWVSDYSPLSPLSSSPSGSVSSVTTILPRLRLSSPRPTLAPHQRVTRERTLRLQLQWCHRVCPNAVALGFPLPSLPSHLSAAALSRGCLSSVVPLLVSGVPQLSDTNIAHN